MAAEIGRPMWGPQVPDVESTVPIRERDRRAPERRRRSEHRKEQPRERGESEVPPEDPASSGEGRRVDVVV